MDRGSESGDGNQESDYDVDSDDAESVCSTLPTHPQTMEEPSFKVFIRNFPPSVKKEDIESHIQSCGLSENVRAIRIFYGKDKKSKGCGYVDITPPNAGHKAISVLNGSLLLGEHKIEAEIYKEAKKTRSHNARQPSDRGLHKIFVTTYPGKLPPTIESSHLQQHFRIFQVYPEQVYIETNPKTKQSKGYAFATFPSKQTADSAIKRLDGSCVHGYTLKVVFAKERDVKPSGSDPCVSHKSSPQRSANTARSPQKTQPITHTGMPQTTSGSHLAASKVLVGGLPESVQPQYSLNAHIPGHPVVAQPTIAAQLLPQASFEPTPSSTIILSNLSPEIDKDSIATLCKGSVINLKIAEGDFNCRKAIITFSSQEAAQEAIKMLDGKNFLGQTVSADYCSPPQQPHHPVVEHTPVGAYMYPVKVTQLAPTVNEVNLRSIFEAAGEIVECRVFPSTNRYALVNFSLESGADTAADMFNGKAIDGSIVNVSKKPPRQIEGHNPPSTSPPCQPAMVEVSNLNPTLQMHEHWKSLTDVFSVYKSAKVENVTPPNDLITFGDMNEARKAADVLNQSSISGSLVQVTVKPSQRHSSAEPTAAEVQSTIDLNSSQCNLLTSIRPSGSSLYQELVQPFMANPNVNIELLLAEVALRFTGKKDAVESASHHFRAHLQRHIPIELECAQALMEIYPDLPKEIREKYGVTLVGLQEGTSIFKLDGPQGGVSQARAEIDRIITRFQKLVARSCLVLTTDLLASARKRFKNEGINVFISHLPCSPEITIYSFSQDDQEKAQKIMCSKPPTRYVPFQPNTSLKELPLNDIAAEFCVSVDVNESERKIYVRAFVWPDVVSAQKRIEDCIPQLSVSAFVCSPEQMHYLRCKLSSQEEATQQVLDSLPAKVLNQVDTKRPLCFKGSPLDIENSQKQLLEGPLLQGLQFRSFTFKAKQKFFQQIEQHILKPIKREHPDLEYYVQGAFGKNPTKGRRGPTNAEESELTFTVLSQEPEVYDKAVSALEAISPSFRALSVRHSKALECVQEKVGEYERRYRVRIVIPKESSKVLIFGLTDDEAGKCLTELREHIDSSITDEKYIKVNRTEVKYLQKKRSEEWTELEGICKEFKLCNRETDTAMIRVKGTIQQVRAVQQKLKAMQGLKFITKVFTVSIDKRHSSMWWKHWKGVKKEQEELYDIVIEDPKKCDAEARGADEGATIAYEFTICGSDETGSDKAAEELSKTHTTQKIINLSEMATKQLDKGRKEKELHVTDQYIVNMFIDFRGHRVILTAPGESSDDLEAAEGEIQRFIGNHTLMEKDIMVDDQVIGLILCSNKSKHSPHLVHANQISKPHGVSVQCLRHPLRGLRLRGSPEGIMQVEPLIHQSVIAQIQATVDKLQFPVDALLLPFVESPEFVHFKSKLRDELCVLCTFPKSKKNNKIVKSVYLKTTTSASCVKVEVSKGKLINEHTSVDAIVNAANEHLQHNGGVARSIVEAGGEVIQKESSEYTKRNGRLKTGDVVCLGAGNLACKKIIHAVGPRWVDGSKGEEQALYFTVLSCLQACQREGFESIALPAGIFGVPDQVCVQASLKAIRDFCQSTPNMCITIVRLVLLHDFVAERFALALDSDILLGCTLSESLATTCTTFSHDYTWEWMDDTGTFTPYESQLSAQLNDAYKNNPNGSTSLIVNGRSYTVHFDTMLQVNTVTKFTRRMRRVSPSSATATTEQPSVLWKYCNDLQTWTPYEPDDSQAIEKMYQRQTPGQLVIKGKMYGFDFSQMSQINMGTSYSRSIKRSIMDIPEVQSPGVEGKQIIITLCGPTANLPLAKSTLDDKLKSAIRKEDITFATPLEKKIISIVEEHRLTFRVAAAAAGGDHKRGTKNITFHGLSSAVKEALSAIQEEIINYHTSTTRPDESGVEDPEEWESRAQSNNLELFPVDSGSPEWHKVVGNFNTTLPNSVIKVTRIQNKWLWERYAQHKQRLAFKNNGNVNEKELFHGTSHNDPRLIYEGEDGFDMRFCVQGMWGLANYFAVNASYSNSYAYTRSYGSREMFMVKVLTGDSYRCDSNRSLRMPPEKPGTGGGQLRFATVRYDTVTGETAGSQVFMTYDNDKAYPAYLIQYSC